MVLTAHAGVLRIVYYISGAVIPPTEVTPHRKTIEYGDVRTKEEYFTLSTVLCVSPIVFVKGLEIGLYKERILRVPHGLQESVGHACDVCIPKAGSAK